MNVNKNMSAKQMMEFMVREELEFHEGGYTKKWKAPPEEYAKRLAIVEKIETEHQMLKPHITLEDMEDDTPVLPV